MITIFGLAALLWWDGAASGDDNLIEAVRKAEVVGAASFRRTRKVLDRQAAEAWYTRDGDRMRHALGLGAWLGFLESELDAAAWVPPASSRRLWVERLGKVWVPRRARVAAVRHALRELTDTIPEVAEAIEDCPALRMHLLDRLARIGDFGRIEITVVPPSEYLATHQVGNGVVRFQFTRPARFPRRVTSIDTLFSVLFELENAVNTPDRIRLDAATTGGRIDRTKYAAAQVDLERSAIHRVHLILAADLYCLRDRRWSIPETSWHHPVTHMYSTQPGYRTRIGRGSVHPALGGVWTSYGRRYDWLAVRGAAIRGDLWRACRILTRLEDQARWVGADRDEEYLDSIRQYMRAKGRWDFGWRVFHLLPRSARSMLAWARPEGFGEALLTVVGRYRLGFGFGF